MADFLFAAAAFVLLVVAIGLVRILRGPGDAERMMAAQLLGSGPALSASLVPRASAVAAAEPGREPAATPAPAPTTTPVPQPAAAPAAPGPCAPAPPAVGRESERPSAGEPPVAGGAGLTA